MQPHLAAATTFHRVGDIYHENGTFQACIAQGTPGTLRMLAGPNTAGSLHVLASTVRIYDSRPNNSPFVGIKTPLAPTEERVVEESADLQRQLSVLLAPRVVPQSAVMEVLTGRRRWPARPILPGVQSCSPRA